MRIGISYWGVCADFEKHRTIDVNTPDGHRYGRPLLIRGLWDHGHTVFALQQRQEPEPYRGIGYDYDFPTLDILLLEWRWKTYKNTPDVVRQDALVAHYKGRCLIIAFDTDLSMTEEDEASVDYVLDPSSAPLRNRIHFPFWSNWVELFAPKQPLPIYGYIGNRYDRDEEFQQLYFEPAAKLREAGVQTIMMGNWLQTSPEREAPETLLSRVTDVAFVPRGNFYDSMKLQNSFLATAHATRDIYKERGFTSPRHIEAALCWCPEVSCGDAVLELRTLSLESRIELVRQQTESLRALNRIQDVNTAVETICKLS